MSEAVKRKVLILDDDVHFARSLKRILDAAGALLEWERHEAGLAAVEQGLDLLIEKPLTPTVEEGEKLCALAESKGLAVSFPELRDCQAGTACDVPAMSFPGLNLADDDYTIIAVARVVVSTLRCSGSRAYTPRRSE